MADIRRIPFTEMVERLQKDFARDNTASEDKFAGRINDTYSIDIPSQIDWRHLRKTSYITTTADYSTGSITVTGTTVTGTDTAWTSANSNNMLFKVDGYDEVYRVTYSAGTTLTLDRTWIGDAITSSTNYQLYQDRYTLASDYDRLILDPNKSIYYWDEGQPVYLYYKDPDEFEALQDDEVNDPEFYTIKWINGDPYLFISPCDGDSRTIHYVYLPVLKRLSEYTTGTVTSLANGGTAVTGSGTDFDGFVTDTTNYDYYLRMDRDGTGAGSKWYKISSASSNTSMTLSDAYVGTTISTGLVYTISMVSQLPPGLDLAIIYGAALVSSADKSNVAQAKVWAGIYDRLVNAYKAVEGKLNLGEERVKTIYERSGVRR